MIRTTDRKRDTQTPPRRARSGSRAKAALQRLAYGMSDTTYAAHGYRTRRDDAEPFSPMYLSSINGEHALQSSMSTITQRNRRTRISSSSHHTRRCVAVTRTTPIGAACVPVPEASRIVGLDPPGRVNTCVTLPVSSRHLLRQRRAAYDTRYGGTSRSAALVRRRWFYSGLELTYSSPSKRRPGRLALVIAALENVRYSRFRCIYLRRHRATLVFPRVHLWPRSTF
jgi:hypothetical protein